MRQHIVTFLAFALTCGFCGLQINDWHFWVVIVGMMVVQVNGMFASTDW